MARVKVTESPDSSPQMTARTTSSSSSSQPPPSHSGTDTTIDSHQGVRTTGTASQPTGSANGQPSTPEDNLAAAVSGLLLLSGIEQGPLQRQLSQGSQTRPDNDDGPNFGPILEARTRDRSPKRVKQEPRRVSQTARPAANVSSVPSLSSTQPPDTGHTDRSSGFDIFQAILQHPHILFHFINSLEIEDLISIYAICKDLHNLVNTTKTAVILSQAMRRAPNAATIFPFRCYRKLCNDDPSIELDQTRGQSRLIPTFRWLRMVHYREQITQRIIHALNAEGLYLPQHCDTVIKKIWFLMDIPDNQRRIALIQNEELWTTSDLFYAVMFFMRIDMRCTNPLKRRARGSIRRMLIAQPSMTMLCRVLERKFLVNSREAVQTYLRWKFEPRHITQSNVFGVSRENLGLLQYEGYGKDGSRVKLQRPDELILKECVRRRMRMVPAFFGILNYTGPRSDAANSTSDDAEQDSDAMDVDVDVDDTEQE